MKKIAIKNNKESYNLGDVNLIMIDGIQEGIIVCDTQYSERRSHSGRNKWDIFIPILDRYEWEEVEGEGLIKLGRRDGINICINIHKRIEGRVKTFTRKVKGEIEIIPLTYDEIQEVVDFWKIPYNWVNPVTKELEVNYIEFGNKEFEPDEDLAAKISDIADAVRLVLS